jgi:transcriptional regulator with XRE-family HTH domain
MLAKPLSSSFLHNDNIIVRDEFCILGLDDMPKRETIGSRLYKRRMELGLSTAQLKDKMYRDFRFEIGESTIRVLERDKVPNPGYKTIEFLALGLGLDPLEVLSLGLDDTPEMETGFKESQFARLYQSYKTLKKDQQAFINESVEMLIAKIDRWR